MTEAPVLPHVDTATRAPLWKTIAKLPGGYSAGAFFVCSTSGQPSHKAMCLGRIHGVECTCSSWTYLDHEGAQAIAFTGPHAAFRVAARMLLGSHWLECWYLDHPDEKRLPFEAWLDHVGDEEQVQIMKFQAERP